MSIPIQAPQIRPDVVSGGQNEGLAPLIQALQQYKISKLQEQRNAIDQQRATSDAALQGAQAARLTQEVKLQEEGEEAWQKQISQAPAALQPFLRMVNGLRGLDPQLQKVVTPILSKQLGFGQAADPETLTRMTALLHLGLPLEVAAHISGVKVRDIADTQSTDPDAIALPKNILKWHYVPPAAANSDESRRLRAQGMIVTQANKDDSVVFRDLSKQKELIAQQVISARNGGRPPLPGTPIQFDPNDGEMTAALHRYIVQHHYDTRLQLNRQNRDAAIQSINQTAQTASQANPAADRLQSVIDLMSQQPDTIPQ